MLPPVEKRKPLAGRHPCVFGSDFAQLIERRNLSKKAIRTACVEVCRTWVAKLSDALTNSENGTRDAEKAVKNGCGTGSDLARQTSAREPERRSETQVLRKNRVPREMEQ